MHVTKIEIKNKIRLDLSVVQCYYFHWRGCGWKWWNFFVCDSECSWASKWIICLEPAHFDCGYISIYLVLQSIRSIIIIIISISRLWIFLSFPTDKNTICHPCTKWAPASDEYACVCFLICMSAFFTLNIF